MTSTDTLTDCDQAFEDHYKTSSRDPSNAGDLAIWRAAWAAKGSDALAAIKAALDLGIELTWQKMIMEIAGDTIDTDSPLSAKVRELSARADAIRLLGEDAGRGES